MHALVGRSPLKAARAVFASDAAAASSNSSPPSKVSKPILRAPSSPTKLSALNYALVNNESHRLYATSSRSPTKVAGKPVAKKAKATTATVKKPASRSRVKDDDSDEDYVPEEKKPMKAAKKTKATKETSPTAQPASAAPTSPKSTPKAIKAKKASPTTSSTPIVIDTSSPKSTKKATKLPNASPASPSKSSLKRTSSLPELKSPSALPPKEPANKRTKKTKAEEIVEAPKPRGRPKKSATPDLEPSPEIKPAKRTSKSTSAKEETTSKTEKAKSVKKSASTSSSAKTAAKPIEVIEISDDEVPGPPKKRGRPATKKPVVEEVVPKIRARAASTPTPVASATITTKRKANASASSEPESLAREPSAIKPSNSNSKLSAAAVAMIKELPTKEDDFIINDELVNLISAETHRGRQAVYNTLNLLREGNTVPFITRYRKEMIGEMDENHVRSIHKAALHYTALQQRKQTVLETILAKGALTAELEQEILKSATMRHLEDLYSPYKPKKNSLADVAIAKGLLPLAETLLTRPHSNAEIEHLIKDSINREKDLNTAQDVLMGIKHIWAEKASDSASLREAVRPIYADFGTLSVSENTSPASQSSAASSSSSNSNQKKDLPSRKRADTFSFYFDFSKPLSALRSHNVMAINRGEREKFLKVKFTVPEEEVLVTMATALSSQFRGVSTILSSLASDTFTAPVLVDAPAPLSTALFDYEALDKTLTSMAGRKPNSTDLDEEDLDDEDYVPSNQEDISIASSSCLDDIPSQLRDFSTQYLLLRDSITDAFKRLLHPSLVKEARNSLTENAEAESIVTFGKNLKSLILKAPVNGHVIMGIDPGFTHGCKLCTIDSSGKVLETRVFFPFSGPSRALEKLREFDYMIRKHNVTLIAIGNGTAHKETIDFVKRYRKEANDTINWCLVDESGASVYSVSPEAQAEFPNMDPAGRGAASIARRTLDPMAEIVKIPTQSIGVGSYQHDVNQKELEKSLSSVVEDCVNYVGVNLNTASQPLLRRISGLNHTQAQNIVSFRDEHGAFKSRSQLKDVKGIGPKTFTQCAGFLRIPESKEPLDNTNIHPESYPQVVKLLKSLKFSTKDILGAESKQKLSTSLDRLDLKSTSESLGLGVPTLSDIITDLKKPGRDPRAEGNIVQIDNQISSFEELKVGMTLIGRIVNVTGFGAFVDVGIEHSGLVLPKDVVDPVTNLPVAQFQVAVDAGYVGQFEVLKIDVARQRFNMRLFLTDQSKLM